MSKIAVILSRDCTLFEPAQAALRALAEAGHEVRVCLFDAQTRCLLHGNQPRPLDPDQLDAIVVGDVAGSSLWFSGAVAIEAVVQDFDQCGRIVAAIGHGLAVFARAGILVGKFTASTMVSELDAVLHAHGAICVGERVVRCGRLATASSKADIEEFVTALLKLLASPGTPPADDWPLADD